MTRSSGRQKYTPPCTWSCKLCRAVLLSSSCHFACSDIRFVVGEERQAVYAHKCLLAARYYQRAASDWWPDSYSYLSTYRGWIKYGCTLCHHTHTHCSTQTHCMKRLCTGVRYFVQCLLRLRRRSLNHPSYWQTSNPPFSLHCWSSFTPTVAVYPQT